MNNIERRDSERIYISDEAVMEEQKPARRLTQKLNTMDRSDFDGITEVCKELLPNMENPFVNPPFYCDYGTHIKGGKNFYCNYNCTILDVGFIYIGDNVLFGPNVQLYSASHPLHPDTRISAWELGLDIHIGDNVWIGGGAVVCPGVSIGNNCVIGAGSVVTKNIPDWSFAAGNPARVIRPITEDDRRYYGKHQPVDEEAWEDIKSKGLDHKNVSPY